MPGALEDFPPRRQVPEPDGSVGARRGEVPAVGALRHTEDVGLVTAESLDQLPGPCVQDLHGPVPARGGELFAVRVKYHATDLGRVPENDRLDPAEPHEVMPFPLAQVFRTLAEELKRPAQVVRGQFAVRKSDAMEVRVALQVAPWPGSRLAARFPWPAVPA